MDLLRQCFHDISRGFTTGKILNRRVYIRHLSHFDQIDQDEKRDEFYQYARSQGALTVEERLKQLKDRGEWTDEKERAIASQEELVNGKRDFLQKHVKAPSEVKRITAQVEAEEAKLLKMQGERLGLIGLTCESYADREVSDYYIYANLFQDDKLTIPFFAREEIDNMDNSEIGRIIADYNRSLECCGEKNVKKLVMQPFFQSYFYLLSDDIYPFFAKPICSLTFFQVTLLQTALKFRNIYSAHDTSGWPKHIQDDPDLFLNYARAVTEGKKEQQDRGGYDQGTVNVGMNNEDAKVLGVRANNDLATQVAQSGGDLIGFLMKNGGNGKQ